MSDDYSVGIPDDHFIRGHIPMTKQEIRVLVLSQAKIKSGHTVIDIGAGTGSLSVEAALQSGTGKVYAVEREPEGFELIKRNAAKFGVATIQPILGDAPAALAGLPQADTIFVGGSGGHLQEILAAARQLIKPGGRIIVTAVTIETLHNTLADMEAQSAFQTEAFCAQITRINKLASCHMLQALNPIYIITAIAPAAE
ncbi:precorrin-6Y C5,15-methyltransferase (decarboxylating) subunit CbiT [Propionispora sp. 2/2-37]|uniref:precorrin-6Y C5,15-methyltransferase (decarboxylating) subunit CbiT n=1 Tax=Propionispora sp. 2/2-37 TaxID=1677858 RepID=UPI001F1C6DB7|nr:precorrin-6Y C5,15-methyltransferase (decarboxylating) subunit CbiT [Propionispora sp. 2/2-37]